MHYKNIQTQLGEIIIREYEFKDADMPQIINKVIMEWQGWHKTDKIHKKDLDDIGNFYQKEIGRASCRERV